MTQAPRAGAIVLAAGRSSRFAGGPKLLAEVDGKPLIRHALEAVLAAPVDAIVLVLAPQTHDAIATAAGQGRWSTCVNPRFAEGLSTSLLAGLNALPGGLDGALVILGDMPGITSGLIGRILDKATQYPEAIVHPLTPEGQQGHPVYWPADIFPQFSELTGDQGGKPLLRRHAHRIVTVPSGRDAATDIDTLEDLANFTARR